MTSSKNSKKNQPENKNWKNSVWYFLVGLMILSIVTTYFNEPVGPSQVNFSDFIHAWVNDDKPILGICLGMQLLFNGSEESTNSPGLAFIPGTVKKLPITNRLRIPHIGWNEIEIIQSDLLTEGVKSHCDMYFVHSYYCPISEYTVAKTYYGVEYSSVLKKGNIVGMQFHPEKSQKNGLNILNNFLELV